MMSMFAVWGWCCIMILLVWSGSADRRLKQLEESLRWQR